jgi:2-dehydro-3-deoxygalactonokinase
MTSKQILSCDWGTSNFRLRLINVEDERIIHEVVDGKGIADMYNEWLQTNQHEEQRLRFYRCYLRSIIDKNFPGEVKQLPIIISGMASSSIGMKELDYGALPFQLSVNNLKTLTIKADDDCTHDVLLVAGLKTANDVMRGEESMLPGCKIHTNEALVIFPGTHSKHVMVNDNAAVDFKTYITGEMFNVLSTQTVLSSSVMKNNNFNKQAFVQGVQEASVDNLLNTSFHVRTNHLFKKYGTSDNYHFLSGLVIGAELKELYDTSLPVYLVCNENLLQQYLTAMEIVKIRQVIHIDADEALINTHCSLHHLLN